MGIVKTRVVVFKELLAPSLCNTKKNKHILKVAIITSGMTVAQRLLTSYRVN